MSRPPSALRQSSLRQTALADLEGLRRRHRDVFRPSWRRRAVVIGTLALVVGLAVLGMVRLDFSLLRILHGLHRLGEFAGMMLPPSTGGSAGAASAALPAIGRYNRIVVPWPGSL